MPSCPLRAEGSVTNETLAAGPVVGEAGKFDGLHCQRNQCDLRPGLDTELQKMVAGEQDAAGLLEAVQAEYLRELEQ